MTQTILKVGGMACSHCVNAVTKAVTALEGVSGVNVDLEDKTVMIDFDADRVSVESIRDAIEEEGYEIN